MAVRKFNKTKYAELLARALPVVIKTEEENERMLALAEKLIDKGDARSPEEDRLLELITKLIADFEEEHYPIPEAPPHRVLQHLMEQRKLRQSDLIHIFGSRGHTSDIVNGKRAISKAHAKALSEFFNVSPELFI